MSIVKFEGECVRKVLLEGEFVSFVKSGSLGLVPRSRCTHKSDPPPRA